MATPAYVPFRPQLRFDRLGVSGNIDRHLGLGMRGLLLPLYDLRPVFLDSPQAPGHGFRVLGRLPEEDLLHALYTAS